MLKISSITLSCLFFLVTPIFAIPVPDAKISFAGAGGIFSSRTATFTVPNDTVITPVENELRLYEVHLAKMIEVTENFCQDRDDDYLIYWNYEAEGGKIFMGEYALSCQFARQTLENFGTSGTENLTIYHRGNPVTEEISVLKINSDNAQEFIELVQSIEPQCIDMTPKICPGDRLE